MESRPFGIPRTASFWSFLLKEGKLICPICCLFRDSCILLLYTLRDYIRGARLPPKPSLRTDVMYESLAFDVFPHNPHIDVVMTLESKVFMEYELCNKSLDAGITAKSSINTMITLSRMHLWVSRPLENISSTHWAFGRGKKDCPPEIEPGSITWQATIITTRSWTHLPTHNENSLWVRDWK